MKLILIHGRDQQGKDPTKLRIEWIDTLKSGLKAQGLELPDDVNIIFPFYGEVLDALARQIAGADDLTGVIAKGAIVDHNKTAYYELLNEMAEQAGLTVSDIQSYYEGEAMEKGPLNWAWVQAIAAALDNCDRIGWASVEHFTADVAFYLNQPTAMRKINEFVASAVDNEPCVVVGHSLGSVVAYNVLTALPNANVIKLITVGSPLGVNAIRSKLKQPLKMPTCVKNGWYNAYDDRDFVALKPLDKNNFDILPPIVNSSHVKNSTSNRHGIAGYLNDKQIAKAIYDAVNGK